ncbi:DUF2225 domain-containing protein [uncultured Clostridium sp.]|uniref:DUF2225 domain-containing protein n=1 Tax=uncultured Clostridium sp. TaxID=59620 RepID=UPI0025DF7562|nr:DUF2225 domain-containing protein [uncultured Clostridium sp.]
MMIDDVRNYLFDKTVTCPVCNSTFKTVCVKSKSARIESKDSDTFIRYTKKVNPYFYDVWICNSCGYTAMKSDFEHIRNFRKELVKSNVTPKWTPREYPRVLDETKAIERYKLALLNAMLTSSPDSTKAMISMKIAWMFRLLEDSKSEQQFLVQALEGFKSAYQFEPFPIYGMQRDSLTYLLGELSRRTGHDEDALLWYSKTLTNTNASYRVKEKARIGKNLIKNK